MGNRIGELYGSPSKFRYLIRIASFGNNHRLLILPVNRTPINRTYSKADVTFVEFIYNETWRHHKYDISYGRTTQEWADMMERKLQTILDRRI